MAVRNKAPADIQIKSLPVFDTSRAKHRSIIICKHGRVRLLLDKEVDTHDSASWTHWTAEALKENLASCVAAPMAITNLSCKMNVGSADSGSDQNASYFFMNEGICSTRLIFSAVRKYR
jgi:hypothetical protein